MATTHPKSPKTKIIETNYQQSKNTTIMTNEIYINELNGYVFMDGKLQTYEFIKCDYKYISDEEVKVIHTAKVGGKQTEIEGDFYTYRSEEAYKKTEIISPRREIIKQNPCYINVDGKPFLTSSEKISRTYYVDRKEVEKESYKNIEEFFSMNDIVVVDAEGNESVSKSLYSRMMPTEEQEKLVKKLMKAVDDVRKSGMRILYDSYYGGISIYNAEHVEDFTDDENEGEYAGLVLRKLPTIHVDDDISCDYLYVNTK